VGCWGRNKGVAIKSIPDGLKDIFGMLTGRGNIAANTAESLRTFKRSETAGHRLFDLHPPDIPFPLVGVKRHANVGHERQHLPFEVVKPHRQGQRRRLFGATSLVPLRCCEGVGLSPGLDDRIIALCKGLKLGRR